MIRLSQEKLLDLYSLIQYNLTQMVILILQTYYLNCTLVQTYCKLPLLLEEESKSAWDKQSMKTY